MRKVKVKIPAKINLALDITGVKGGFHEINSLVASCGLYDAVILCGRKDGVITLKERGLSADVPAEENNAYKAAKLFKETFGTRGVDITINKKIPVGGGLGGSSADIAAVLVGMKRLFGLDCDLKVIAAKLGSDVNYMLSGGFALISGKGDEVKLLDIDLTLHAVLITDPACVSARESYAEYDALGLDVTPVAEKCAEYLLGGDTAGYARTAANCLYGASLKFCPAMEEKNAALRECGAVTALMTGSGSTVFGIFDTRKEALVAKKRLARVYGRRVIYTVISE